ncbi:hypothetical protein Pyn_16900 [Prunus yedoensis var. nudiflora]|uniref:Mediator complex subunit 15 KIX domain-containing protein n=1 Tax=Prunus yedoensis var. nudiflora TaxID=2094558 RepID=A0A315B1U9_PRUYE|nr:hypothetical protein Pyn_16900 [Prunus yedoensis var. nudiflora]
MSPSGDGEPAMDTDNWRSRLQPDSRQRIINKIMETLKRHLPFSGQEALQELKKIAVRFEEKVYTTATSQSDYLRKISLKMLTMETKSQNNSLQSKGSFLTELVPIFLDQSSKDSTAPARHANGADWQEEVYQTIKVMKEMYVSELSELYQKIATKLQLHDSIPEPISEQLEQLKLFKAMLEHLISVLQISKSSILPDLKKQLSLYEKQMIDVINAHRPWKPVSFLKTRAVPHTSFAPHASVTI